MHAPGIDRSLTRRRSVYDYFQQTLRRVRTIPAGEALLVFGEDGHCAAFHFEVRDGRIVDALFRCTTCATLVAFCEHLAELVVGLRPEDAQALTPEALLAMHPEVPAARRDRAILAAQALQSAIRILREEHKP